MKNEKSTFSVLFYLKKDKMKKNGLVPIHARITINGKQTQFNTKLEVLETNWKSGRAIGKSMEIRLSTLEYIGQHKENIVVSERTTGNNTTGQNKTWSIMD